MSLSSLAAVQFNPPETPPIRTSLSLSTTCAAAEGSTSVIRRLGDCERGAAVASFSRSFSLFLTRGWRGEWRPWSSSRLEDAKCGLEKISQAGSRSRRPGKAGRRNTFASDSDSDGKGTCLGRRTIRLARLGYIGRTCPSPRAR